MATGVLHGEAVAIGMVYEAALAERLGIAAPGNGVAGPPERSSVPVWVTRFPRRSPRMKSWPQRAATKRRGRAEAEYALPVTVGAMSGSARPLVSSGERGRRSRGFGVVRLGLCLCTLATSTRARDNVVFWDLPRGILDSDWRAWLRRLFAQHPGLVADRRGRQVPFLVGIGVLSATSRTKMRDPAPPSAGTRPPSFAERPGWVGFDFVLVTKRARGVTNRLKAEPEQAIVLQPKMGVISVDVTEITFR